MLMQLKRVFVPKVRPLLRRFIKRALRLMPSILVILFVFCLIIVTLLQITVIHVYRRSQYVPPQQSVLVIPSTVVNPQIKKFGVDKPETNLTFQKLKKPLRTATALDNKAPSVDNNTLLDGIEHSARLRQIVNVISSHKSSRIRTKKIKVKRLVNENNSVKHVIRMSRNETWMDKTSTQAASLKSDKVVGHSRKKNYQNSQPRKHFNFSKHGTVLCSEVPSDIVGRMNITLTVPTEKDILKIASQLQPGGAWSPASCKSRHRVAIIIPFRDRHEHLMILLYHLHPLLQRQQLDYTIYVVEQFGNDTFNKGVLMNAGVRESLNERNYDCYVFHDVDMIPEDDRNMYSCPQLPRHMSVAVDKFHYTLPYSDLVGGVFALKTKHFLQVNGYSNLYWGWGGEDDDIAHRLEKQELKIIRPPAFIGRYTMIKHKHRAESPNVVRRALLRMAKKRQTKDGFNSAKYSVIYKNQLPLYTHVMISIGHNHRWRFEDKNRIIISF
ncbi:beta-1,4-N-acetylgalactosaminyltransferase bre-4-like [Limulus polyphemus]|uniref:Beta-1,4-N-acetylgalactosaminyltransferase n=1 Tax=Limulus polyphemus TaxID=6850 RepID=A0ABM1TLU1_LIMPO|nr:beta-1,4-N-acetylgalactosaminyltransferase bre-4-like [Limulus polyphemus]